MLALHTLNAAAPTADEPRDQVGAPVGWQHPPAPSWRLPLAVAVIAVVVRLIPAALTFGTSDVMSWELLGRLYLNGENFYLSQLHNWPALWIYFTAAAVLIHDATGVPFPLLVKLPPIAADAAIAVLLYHIALRSARRSTRPRVAWPGGAAWPPAPSAGTPSEAASADSTIAPRSSQHSTPPSLASQPGAPSPLTPSAGKPSEAASADSNIALRPQERSSPPSAAWRADAPSPLAPSAGTPSEAESGDATIAPRSTQDSTPSSVHWRADAPSAPASSARTPPETASGDSTVAAVPRQTAARPGSLQGHAALAGLAYALNPVTVLISGYHGQFDSLMLAPTLLAWWFFPRRLVASALALGLGVWFKPVPLLLLPVLLPNLARWRDRLVYAALAVAPATLGTLPYFVQWPEDVASNFLGYSSWFGQWGYPVIWMLFEYMRNGTVPWWLPDPAHVSLPLRLMFEAGRWVLLSALVATWWLAYRRGADVLHSILCTFVVFYVATSGFGVQYLLWIVPFAIAARDRWLWRFSAAATGLLLVAYTLGLAYLPQAASPDNGPSLREFVVKLASLPAWIVCALWAWSLLRRLRVGSDKTLEWRGEHDDVNLAAPG